MQRNLKIGDVVVGTFYNNRKEKGVIYYIGKHGVSIYSLKNHQNYSLKGFNHIVIDTVEPLVGCSNLTLDQLKLTIPEYFI